MFGSKKLFESDIKPLHKCLEKNYLNSDAPALNICFLDIETAFSKKNGFAPPSDPFNEITAISLYLNWLDKMITLVIKPHTLTVAQAEEICNKFPNTILCSTEREMLENFLTLIEDVDIFSGWNSEGFDIPYIVNRISKIIGRDYTRKFCLWDQLPKAREYEKYGKTATTYDFVGRIHLDYLELYRKYTYEERHSFSLDAIGEYELEERKLAYEGTLDQLYNNDFEKFIAYNRQDTALLHKLDAKLQFIDLVNVLAHANTVPLPTTMGVVAVTDQAIINEAHGRNLIVADKNRDTADTQAAGAYVAYPKKGIHEWIGSMDLNSLYPSIIRALNMSPETIVGQIKQDDTKAMIAQGLAKGNTFAECWDGVFSCLEYDKVMSKDIGTILTIEWTNGQTQTMSAAQVYDQIFMNGQSLILSANGTLFSYASRGVIPGLLERWYAERKVLQKKAKECTDKKEFEYWDKRQLVKKIGLNGLYGALLNPGSRFFDQRLGQSTTLTGRCIARHMASQVNEMFTGVYDHNGQAIIYGDTDSTYFSAYPVFKKEIERGELEWNKEKVIELYDTVCNEVNETFPGFMEKVFNVPPMYGKVIAAGREVVASRGIYITKKRYAVLVYDKEGKRKDVNDSPGEVKAMGLDLRRSDTPEYMQKFLSEILLMLLTNQSQSSILDKIIEFRNNFKKKPSWDKGTPKRVNNLTNHTRVYEKTGKCGIGHALAAINWNRLRRAHSDQYSLDIVDGMKTIVCKLKFNPLGMTSIGYPTDEKRLPEWFKELPFDDAEMEKAIIDAKVENLIGVLNWPLETTRLDNNFADLFE